MKLTPLDIHHKDFKKAIRGYNEEEVDAFLDEVAEEFERLFKENVEMRENQEALEEKMKQYENIEATLQNTFLSAQKSAEELQSNARKEAELIIKDAELKSKQMIQEAYNQQKGIRLSFERIKQAENEFRMKFKSLLKSYLSVIEETEANQVDDFKMEVSEELEEISKIEEEPELEIEEPETEEEIILKDEEKPKEAEEVEVKTEEPAQVAEDKEPATKREDEEEEVLIKISEDLIGEEEDSPKKEKIDEDDNLEIEDNNSEIDIEEIS